MLRLRFVTIRYEAYLGVVIDTMTTKPLQSAFASMHVSLRAGMNEDDIERLFGDIYVALGYTKVAKDTLGKRGGKSGIPDVRLLNSDESIQVIVELKKPSENLADHENQLFRYVRDLKARYGLLSNGANVWLYRRNDLALEPLIRTTSAALGEDASVNIRHQSSRAATTLTATSSSKTSPFHLRPKTSRRLSPSSPKR